MLHHFLHDFSAIASLNFGGGTSVSKAPPMDGETCRNCPKENGCCDAKIHSILGGSSHES